MSIYSQKPIDLAGISTYPLDSRPSKVSVNDFARPLTDGEVSGVAALIDSLPRMLGADDLRSVARAIVAARAAKRAIIWGLGGHVIKTGLAPIVTDLAQRGFVTAVAMNGSGIIHDFEIALAGTTSEDVDEALGSGSFGMAEETGRLINEAIKRGAADQLGIGEAIGRTLAEISPKFAEYSLLHAAYKMRIPVTVHVTVGTDIVHLHPQADGAAIGEASHRDFRLFTSLVKGMSGGGVYLNVGSAVTLPEVFLKAVTVVRNMGDELRGLTTVNCDFLQHYRPLTNVVRRPVAGGAGRGYSLTGHHELMLPLLAAAVRSLRGKER
ncbi:MAG: deoxyhypusine synthase family protein [Acidobacteria bacterium]|nr:deoxyhypusine synthase family protein [Acidobacteriota bacterium]MCW5971426.1 deoxyhypusine synthase family protein [Blastocatellales bacterium]